MRLMSWIFLAQEGKMKYGMQGASHLGAASRQQPWHSCMNRSVTVIGRNKLQCIWVVQHSCEYATSMF